MYYSIVKFLNINFEKEMGCSETEVNLVMENLFRRCLAERFYTKDEGRVTNTWTVKHKISPDGLVTIIKSIDVDFNIRTWEDKKKVFQKECLVRTDRIQKEYEDRQHKKNFPFITF